MAPRRSPLKRGLLVNEPAFPFITLMRSPSLLRDPSSSPHSPINFWNGSGSFVGSSYTVLRRTMSLEESRNEKSRRNRVPNPGESRESPSEIAGNGEGIPDRVGDAAIAVKDVQGRVKLNQMINTSAARAIGGAFWGALIGLIFLMPLAGSPVGAASGAIGGALTDLGINNQFMTDAAAAIQPGTAALFVLARKVQCR
jgi:Protein of unknown function (DUF1269)